MERAIIAGIDRSAHSRVAAEWAARQALLRGLPLWVAHVSPSNGTETMAGQVAAELTTRHPALTIRSLKLDGAPVPALCASAENAELLVVGLRGEAAGAGVGSTASALAAECARPVVLVPGTLAGRGRPGDVVLGIDARDPADHAIARAFEEARLRGTRLHTVYAWTLPPDHERSPFPVLEEDRATWEDQEVQLLSDALRPWCGKYPEVEVLQDVRLLAPAEALAQASIHAELVVVGRGATAFALLSRARWPVTVVPSPPRSARWTGHSAPVGRTECRPP
ncbi:hypothetical protein SLINC_7916 [Streptomyces lincolnensis]|uniref:Uncharacterized protein n=1 Tax=Streptomyces lincolnensis TaxID=1915 RepID=A0A1B1MNE9_STRLN|nr:universal stress protein [Streptomyces lincolnensis]ANS70140.1 hypothetical protein SLINC_7916 [Streptomyces lincolnensis]AXG59037.1 hypothetical protein SLCG_7882 [Streptomyces lincolnensis]QMV11631.1 universal stress protein [Streptomyces lincolnensis]